jgi:hypothetical protein
MFIRVTPDLAVGAKKIAKATVLGFNSIADQLLLQ